MTWQLALQIMLGMILGRLAWRLFCEGKAMVQARHVHNFGLLIDFEDDLRDDYGFHLAYWQCTVPGCRQVKLKALSVAKPFYPKPEAVVHADPR